MATSFPRLAVAATACALVLAPFLATPGFGGPDSKAKPPAKAPAKGATSAPASLADVESAFDAQEKEAREAIRAKRYDAIAAYVKANASATDLEEARKTLVDLAEELEAHENVVAQADEFLAKHATSDDALEVRISRAGALASLDRTADAKTAYEAITKDGKFGVDNANLLVGAWRAYAGLLTDLGDLDGARKAWAGMKEAIPHPQIAQMADAAILEVDLIGTDPSALPETAKDLDGKPVVLADLKGKLVLLDFWATWCGPCRGEIPHLVQAHSTYKDKGLEIVGVSLDTEASAGGKVPHEVVQKFIAAKRMGWKQIVYDTGENEVTELYNVHGIPHTILIGRDGKILRIGLRGTDLLRVIARQLSSDARKPATPAK